MRRTLFHPSQPAAAHNFMNPIIWTDGRFRFGLCRADRQPLVPTAARDVACELGCLLPLRLDGAVLGGGLVGATNVPERPRAAGPRVMSQSGQFVGDRLPG